ncbi:MAG TPA: FtsX-like permease family protein [Acidimicrobiia bacterium]
MWKATIRGLFARKVRLALTALAILMGVAFVSATYVLTDSVKRSFESVFAQTLTGVDLQVQGASALGDGSTPGRIPDSTVDQVGAVPGVRTAQGFVRTSLAQFVDADGDTIGGGGPPTFGISWVDDGPLRLTDGHPPDGPGQVAMDAGTAEQHGYHVGDRVRVLLSGAAKEYEIVGLFGFGDTTDFGAVTFAAFDFATAQREFDAAGSVDAVYVQRDPDVTTSELQTRIEDTLGPGYEVLTASEATLQVGQPVRQFLGFFTDALLGFAAIGVVVGAFIIFNTFTILVAQRTRELGLLRAMGATGGQVVRSVVLEALVVGAVASAIGLGFGVLLGVGLLDLLREIGLDLPATSTVVLGRTVVVSLFVGIVVTVVAAAIPAVRAARVPPVAAIADVPERAVGAFGRRIVIGLLVLMAGAAFLAYGLARARDVSGILDQVQVVAFGAFGVLVGVVLLLPVVVRPAVRALGAPLRRLGPPGVLARANAMRNPRRTAITASALVIGLALVGLTATFGASARASVGESTAAGLRADYVVKSDGFAAFSTEVVDRLHDLPEVTTAASMRFTDGAVDGDVKTVGSIDPKDLTDVVDLQVLRGDAAALDDTGVLVSDELARHAGVDIGDQLPVQFSVGQVPLTVRAVYAQQNFIGLFGQAVPLLVAPATISLGSGGTPQDSLVLVQTDGGETLANQRALQDALAKDFPNIDVLTRAQFRDDQQAQVDQFLTVLIAILTLSEIIAILGIINTLALSVYERTRELGLLRVVGMSRRQVRRMIRWESVVIAVLGGIVGLALGMLWGWAFARALEEQGITVFRIPWLEVLLFVGGSMIAGVLAAVFPAWRASRLDVLDAIATE